MVRSSPLDAQTRITSVRDVLAMNATRDAYLVQVRGPDLGRRLLLNDPDFLKDPDNRWGSSRRLMGLPVRIVPDHQTEFTLAAG